MAAVSGRRRRAASSAGKPPTQSAAPTWCRAVAASSIGRSSVRAMAWLPAAEAATTTSAAPSSAARRPGPGVPRGRASRPSAATASSDTASARTKSAPNTPVAGVSRVAARASRPRPPPTSSTASVAAAPARTVRRPMRWSRSASSVPSRRGAGPCRPDCVRPPRLQVSWSQRFTPWVCPPRAIAGQGRQQQRPEGDAAEQHGAGGEFRRAQQHADEPEEVEELVQGGRA